MAYQISTLVFGILVFSTLVVAFSIGAADLANEYGKNIDDLQYMSVADDIREMTEETKQAMTQDITTSQGFGSEIINFFYTGITAVWSAMHIMMGSIGLVTGIIVDATGILHIPAWGGGILITAVLLFVVFAFARLIAKTEG